MNFYFKIFCTSKIILVLVKMQNFPYEIHEKILSFVTNHKEAVAVFKTWRDICLKKHLLYKCKNMKEFEKQKNKHLRFYLNLSFCQSITDFSALGTVPYFKFKMV